MMSSNIEIKLKSNFKKWMKLWFKYFLIIGAISILLHSWYKEPIAYSWHDIIEIFVYDGKTLSMDHIVIKGESTGLYTIWFLLCGAYAFAFYYIYKKYLRIGNLVLVVAIMFLIGTSLSALDYKTPRWLYLSIPYTGLGMLAKNFQKKMVPNNKSILLLILTLFSCVYIEFFIANLKGISIETSLLSPVLMFFFFIAILRYNPQGKASKYLANLGRSTTLDIYIYHRPIYALLLAITPPSEYWIYHKAGAIIVFVITLTLVMTVKSIKKTCNIK